MQEPTLHSARRTKQLQVLKVRPFKEVAGNRFMRAPFMKREALCLRLISGARSICFRPAWGTDPSSEQDLLQEFGTVPDPSHSTATRLLSNP